MSSRSKNSGLPIPAELASQLDTVLSKLSPSQLAWLGGYVTGLAGLDPDQSATAPSSEGDSVTILFGTQTGNGEGIAEQLAEQAKSRGFNPVLVSMGDYSTARLKSEKNLMLIASTHGEGDPPDMAEDLYEFLHSKRAPKLKGCRFTVLALGDTSYEFFCKTGKDFDRRLEELGAGRFYPRVDCDLDYDQDAEAWIQGALECLSKVDGVSTVQVSEEAPVVSLPVYDRKNPFPAEILESINLNGRGSAKETLHVELSLEGSGLQYEPGDALGVYPSNDPVGVAELIQIMGFSGTEEVELAQRTCSLSEALTVDLEWTVLTKPLLAKYAAFNQKSTVGLQEMLEDGGRDALRAFLEGRDLRDLVEAFPVPGVSPQDLVGILRKLPARLYSIASSPLAHPDEVHLTVGVVRYQTHGRERGGVCSTFLMDRVAGESRIPVYVDINKNFKLPADPDAPVIMIGPGTGIAPFRAFVEHRQEEGEKGRNWLFFGDQHFQTDFLYQTEWQLALKRGVLTRMDVAFSRDQSEKVYVQDRMLERSRELYAWIQEGAYLYVCGDESRMAHDVQKTLLKIFRDEGGQGEDQAEATLRSLQKEKRYQRDVY